MRIHSIPRCLLGIVLLLLLCAVCKGAVSMKTVRVARAGYYKALVRYPVFSEPTPIAYLANRTVASWVKQDLRRFEQECQAAVQQRGKLPAPCDYDAQGQATYANAARLVSIRFRRMEFTGGAHPNTDFVVFNFGMIQGKLKRLTLSDFFRPGSDYARTVSDAVIAKLKQNSNATEVVDGSVKALTPEQLNRFVVEATGLRFLLNPAEVGPYVAGPFEVSLSPAELGPDFNKSLLAAR